MSRWVNRWLIWSNRWRTRRRLLELARKHDAQIATLAGANTRLDAIRAKVFTPEIRVGPPGVQPDDPK